MEEIRRPNRSRYTPMHMNYNEWENYKNSIGMFFSMLTDEDRENLLKNEEFRNFLVSDRNAFFELIDDLNEREPFLLFDDEFIDNLFSSEKSANVAYSVLEIMRNRPARDKIVSKYRYIILTNPKNLTQISSVFDYLSDDLRFEIFSEFIKNNTIDICLLAYFLRAVYPKRYVYREDLNYDENESAISKIASLLNDKEIRKIIYEDYSLLSELDPANRSILYLNKNYYEMSDVEKKNLFKLLKENVDVTLGESIFLDGDFIEDVAYIEDVVEYKTVMQSLKLNTPRAIENIKEKRNEYYDYYIDKFKNEDLEEFTSTTSEKITSHIADYIFDRYFEACPTDSLYSACVVFDAMDMPGFEKHLTKDGLQVIEKLKDLLIEITRKNEYVSSLNKSVEREDLELIDELKELSDLMDKVPNFAEKFVRLMKTARKTFETQVRRSISKLKTTQIEHESGATVYEIDYKSPFMMLVHSQVIKQVEREVIMPNVPKARHELNVSMSLLDNNHLRTFGDKNLEDYVNFGFISIGENALKHAYVRDSFTDYAVSRGNIRRLEYVVSEYPPTYIDLQNFMAWTADNNYNELKIHAHANATSSSGENIMKPDYILCKDNIREIEIEISKKFNIPIVFVNTKKVERIKSNRNYEPTLHKTYEEFDVVAYQDKTNPLIT